jgi:hypothetical protein
LLRHGRDGGDFVPVRAKGSPALRGPTTANFLQNPTRTFEAGSGFGVQDVSLNFFVAHRLCDPSARPIEHGARIDRTIRNKAGYLNCSVVIQRTTGGSHTDGCAYEDAIGFTANAKLGDTDGFMVTVQAGYKVVGLSEMKWNDPE